MSSAGLPRAILSTGHSTGALIALLAHRHGGPRRRMVLSAPLLEFNDLPLFHARNAAHDTAVEDDWPRRMIMSGRRKNGWPAPFATNKLTSDPDRYRAQSRHL
jgi:alpha-beta hydrolase superfamily lysophospholipase